jgi:hypothetical protein
MAETSPTAKSNRKIKTPFGKQGGKQARRGGGPRALAQAVSRITRPLFNRRGLSGAAFIEDWPAIAGEHLAARTLPERVTYPAGRQDGGTLHLRVESGGLATEVQHLEPLLVERINGYFGYRAVSALRLVQGPLPRRVEKLPPPVKALNDEQERRLSGHLSTVDDPELRLALEALGRSVLGRSAANK